MNCIIIDDQEVAIEVLLDHVKKKPELTLIKTFTNPLEAMLFVENNKIDIIFIDVQMPHLNGLDFIKNLRAKKGNNVPIFILTTGYSEHDLPDLEPGVIHLLKPIGFKRFNIAIDRLIQLQ